MNASLTTDEPLWDLCEESLGEAQFLWQRWEADLTSLTRNLDEVWSWTEDRLQGALDGVRASGARMPAFLESSLSADDLPLLAVSAHLLAANSPAEARGLLGTALGEASGPRLWAMVRGIELAELDGSFAPLVPLLATKSPEHAAALCRLKASRRSAPGPELADAFNSNVPALQIEALRAAQLSRDPAMAKYVAAGLRSDAAAVRIAAIECGVRLGLPEAWAAATQLAHERSPEAGPLLPLVAALGSLEEHAIVVATLREPALQRAGLFALGFLGTREAVELCISGMRAEKLSRSAGEAYCAITGADLEGDRLAAGEPPDAASPPPFEADDLDGNLVPQPDELWPLPDPDAVQRHWQAMQARFAPGVRYLRGRPSDLGVLIDTIEGGPMLRRAGLILEATVRTSGQYDVEPRAFAHVQRRMMAASRNRASAASR
jgi:uncharacterized protein (TIGR02270 family)